MSRFHFSIPPCDRSKVFFARQQKLAQATSRTKEYLLVTRMFRVIKRKFVNGELTPSSRLTALPHVGAYLYERLRRKYAPRARNITLRQFARSVAALPTAELQIGLQRALQNERTNQCVGRRGKRYHVRDINEKGWDAMVALLRVFKVGADGYGLGRHMTANPRNIRYAAHRSQAAKQAACQSRGICMSPNVWRSRTCLHVDASGFEGVDVYPGQRVRHINQAVVHQRLSRDRSLELTGARARRDPGTTGDLRSGHGAARYTKLDDNTYVRKAGRIVRLPL